MVFREHSCLHSALRTPNSAFVRSPPPGHTRVPRPPGPLHFWGQPPRQRQAALAAARHPAPSRQLNLARHLRSSRPHSSRPPGSSHSTRFHGLQTRQSSAVGRRPDRFSRTCALLIAKTVLRNSASVARGWASWASPFTRIVIPGPSAREKRITPGARPRKP
jgi:hypothetical protein